MPFPKVFPLEAVATLAGYLRKPDQLLQRQAVEAAYDLLGFALSTAYEAGAPVKVAVPVTEDEPEGEFYYDSETDLATKVEASFAPDSTSKLPEWLVPLLLEVLRRLLA